MASMGVKEFFEEYWSTSAFRGFDDLRERLSCPRSYARSLLGDLRGKRVLEIGPGRGDDLRHLIGSGGKVTGIDISERALEMVKNSIKNTTLSICRMDACSLGFKSNVFDLVFLNTCLMHLDRTRLFPEICAVLRRGGRVLSIEPLKLNPFVFLYRSICSPGRCISPSYFTLEEIEGLRKSFGEVRHQEFYLAAPLVLALGALFPAARRLIPLFEALDSLILKLLRPLRRLSWIVVLECVKR